jgi:hypothetical protein
MISVLTWTVSTDHLEVRFRRSEGWSYRRPTNWSYPRYRRQGRRINVVCTKIERILVMDGVAKGKMPWDGLVLASSMRLLRIAAGCLKMDNGGCSALRSSQGYSAGAAERLVLAYTMYEIKILCGAKSKPPSKSHRGVEHVEQSRRSDQFELVPVSIVFGVTLCCSFVSVFEVTCPSIRESCEGPLESKPCRAQPSVSQWSVPLQAII